MTTFATQSPATGPWKTADEVSRETGLRPDLVLRFIPHTETPNGPRYNPHHVALAGTVKQMTDAGAPADAIDAAVRDLLQRPDLTAGAPLTRSPKRRNGQLLTVAGITAAIALLIGGVIGGLIGSGNRNTTTAAPHPSPSPRRRRSRMFQLCPIRSAQSGTPSRPSTRRSKRTGPRRIRGFLHLAGRLRNVR